MTKISFHEITIEKLSEEDDLSGFDCGDADLNEFIKIDAIKQMNAKMNVTYICKSIYDNDPLGFLTISNDSIKIRNKDKKAIRNKIS